MSYISLHIYTGYTFLNSCLQIEQIVSFAKKNNFKYLGISDVNVMYGFAEFNNICLKNDIKPIFGMDLTCDGMELTLYVENEVGYKNLCKISTLLNSKNKFNIENLKELNEGLICVFSSKNDIFSKVDEKNFSSTFSTISNLFKKFYIGMEIYHKEELFLADKIRNFAQNYRYDIIAFPKIKYLRQKDAIVLDILKNIQEQTLIDTKLLDEKNSPIPYLGDYFFKTNQEITKFYTELEIENTNTFFSNLDFIFLKKRGHLLSFSSNLEDSSTLLKTKILEGLKIRNIDITLSENKKYKDRLNYEFLTIKNMGYQDYFLIVQDYVKYAKKNNIPVGPGRGSAAGSLISYLLEITEVDPLKYNLLFERFLNPNRKTMPDIDVDFSDIHRDLIFNYITNKYGKNRTARVIAFQTFGTKQSIRDITKVLGYPPNIANDLCKIIPNNFKKGQYKLLDAYNEIPAFKEAIDNSEDNKIIARYVTKIEGLPRQRGLHAAGIIIDQNELDYEIPLVFENESTFVTQYEKDYLEEQGFLKMDILGLSNLSTIYNCLNLIKKNKNIDVNLLSIDFNDSKIYECIKQYRTMGIFQLDTSAALNAIKIIKPSNFNDVVATISLDRPGPMEQMPTYALRKEGKQKIVYLDKRLEPILKETYGIIVYQEQIMQIARSLASFSFAEADTFRKAISKKKISEIEKLKHEFIKGCIKNGVDSKIANQIYCDIEKFASYGFNKSHAVSYAYIALQECYLKTYYPLEFYLAILDQQYGSNDAKFSKYLQEIKKENLEVLLPNINESTTSFTNYNNKLLLPLTGISNFPNKQIENIIVERNKNGKFTSFYDFIKRMCNNEYKLSDTQVSKLVDAGAFDSLNKNRKSLKMSINLAIEHIKKYNMFKLGDEFKEIETEDDPIARIKNEYEALGVMLSDNLLNYIHDDSLKNITITPINELKLNKFSTILVTLRSKKVITIKNGKEKGKFMAFLSLYDNSGEIEAVLFNKEYDEHGQNLKENDCLILKGKTILRKDELSFQISEIKVISED